MRPVRGSRIDTPPGGVQSAANRRPELWLSTHSGRFSPDPWKERLPGEIANVVMMRQ